jgi:hypothetical protein
MPVSEGKRCLLGQWEPLWASEGIQESSDGEGRRSGMLALGVPDQFRA